MHQQAYRLNMPCLGEEVYRAEFGGAPAQAGEGGDVAGQSLGVTAYIDDTARAARRSASPP